MVIHRYGGDTGLYTSMVKIRGYTQVWWRYVVIHRYGGDMELYIGMEEIRGYT